MQDRAGNTLYPGDEVYYLETTGNGRVTLEVGTIDRLTEKRVLFRVEGKYHNVRTCPPERVLKPFKE